MTVLQDTSASIASEHPQTPARHLSLRVGPVSTLMPVRAVVVVVVGLVVAAVLYAFNISQGEVDIPIVDVVRALFGQGDSGTQYIVTELRMPQATVALLVGAALGLSGALMQTFARNALATPDMIGITDGASVAAVSFILLAANGVALWPWLDWLGVSAFAFVGGMAVAVTLYVLSWRRGIDGQRLILVGIGLSLTLQAFTAWLLIEARLDVSTGAFKWLNGSLSGRNLDQAEPLVWGLAVLVPLTLLLVAGLRILQLGDDSARGLGLRLQWHQLLVLLSSVALCSLVVSVAGPIDFVAFVVPQIGLRLTRGSRPPLVASMVLGAALVVAADVVGRALLPVVVPAGLVTSAIGAPYLIWLLIRMNRKVSA